MNEYEIARQVAMKFHFDQYSFNAAVADKFYSATQEFNNAAQEFYMAAISHSRPHVLMRPQVTLDGDMWCALYGENLQGGVVGYGKTPEDACSNFDKAWSGSAQS